MSYNSLRNRTCTIQEKTLTASATGAQTKTWANKATSVKYTVQTISGGDVSEEWAENSGITHIAFFEISDDIVKGNKVIDGTTEYIVKRIDDAGGRGHHKEVMMELLA